MADFTNYDYGVLHSTTKEVLDRTLGALKSDFDTSEATYNTHISEYELVKDALEGKVVLIATPSTLGSSAAAVNTAIGGAGFTRDVVLTVKTASGGSVHSWYNGTLTCSIAESTAGNGTASIGGATSVTFANGVATVTITYTGTWAAADTCTFTVSSINIAGKSLSNVTSVDTLVA